MRIGLKKNNASKQYCCITEQPWSATLYNLLLLKSDITKIAVTTASSVNFIWFLILTSFRSYFKNRCFNNPCLKETPTKNSTEKALATQQAKKMLKGNDRNTRKRCKTSFKLTNKDTRSTLTLRWCLYCQLGMYFTTFFHALFHTGFSIIEFEHVTVCWERKRNKKHTHKATIKHMT